MRPVVSSSLCALAGGVKSAAIIAATAASAVRAAIAALRTVRVIGGSFGCWASLRKLGRRWGWGKRARLGLDSSRMPATSHRYDERGPLSPRWREPPAAPHPTTAASAA